MPQTQNFCRTFLSVIFLNLKIHHFIVFKNSSVLFKFHRIIAVLSVEEIVKTHNSKALAVAAAKKVLG